MEKGEYTGTAVPGYSTYRITSLLVLSEALTSFLVFLDFPDHLPAPKMFKLQYFLIFFFFFPFGLCLHGVLVNFFFSSPHNALSLEAGPQLVEVNSDLALGTYSEASLHQPGNQAQCITGLCPAMT